MNVAIALYLAVSSCLPAVSEVSEARHFNSPPGRLWPVAQIYAGEKRLGIAHEITRNVKEGFFLAFPERKGKPVPDIIKIALLIDSNTMNSTVESKLDWVRFEAASDDMSAAGPEK